LAYATGVLGATISQGTGNPLGLALVFFVPGYVSVASIYPSNDEIRWASRLALSLVVSVAIVPSLSLMLNLANIGLEPFSVSLAVTLYVIVVGLIAYLRRMKLPADQRLCAHLELAWPRGKDMPLLDKLVTIALASCVVVVACFLAYIAVIPRGGDRFTEFYLLGPNGNMSNFPSTLNVSQPGAVTIGLVNREGITTSYGVRVDLVGVQVVYNATTASNETKDVNRTTWSWINFTLADRESWNDPYGFSISLIGLWKVQLLLFKDGYFTIAYRTLHFFVQVR